jgi:cytochrome c oxidase subunit IV
MAFKPKVGWEWTFLRYCLGLSWITTLVYVTIPDYGYDYTLFMNLGYDPTGWLHECFYISTFFISAVTLTYFWERLSCAKCVLVRTVKRIEKDL